MLVFLCLNIAWYSCIWKTSFAITNLYFSIAEGFFFTLGTYKRKNKNTNDQ